MLMRALISLGPKAENVRHTCKLPKRELARSSLGVVM